MAAVITALRDVINAVPEYGDLPGASIETTIAGHFTVHVRDCTAGRLRGVRRATRLLAEVVDNPPSSATGTLCINCTLLGPEKDKQYLWDIAEVYANTARACTLLSAGRPRPNPLRIEEHGTKLLPLAAKFLRTEAVISADALQGLPPALADLLVREWNRGKAAFDEVVSWNVSGDVVKRHPGGELVVCEQGHRFRQQWEDLDALPELPATVALVALLEGPRLGQTRTHFVTTAPWAPGAGVNDGGHSFEHPGVDDAEAYTAALELWDGQRASDLTDLVRGVESALRVETMRT